MGETIASNVLSAVHSRLRNQAFHHVVVDVADCTSTGRRFEKGALDTPSRGVTRLDSAPANSSRHRSSGEGKPAAKRNYGLFSNFEWRVSGSYAGEAGWERGTGKLILRNA